MLCYWYGYNVSYAIRDNRRLNMTKKIPKIISCCNCHVSSEWARELAYKQLKVKPKIENDRKSTGK